MKGIERLVFGDDIDMDRVVEFSKKAVVNKIRLKNWVWIS